MVDVAKALILPDLGPPDRRQLLTNVLFWDLVVVNMPRVAPSEEEVDLLKDLEARGAIQLLPARAQSEPRTAPDRTTRSRVLATLEDGARGRTPVRDVVQRVRLLYDLAALVVADDQLADVRDALATSAALGLAPVSLGFFSQFGALLPSEQLGAPREPAALISVAVDGVMLSDSTTVDAVLQFKEKHRREVGGFRAAMVDLSSALTADAPPARLMEEAAAVVANRVEPSLGALEEALRAGKLKFMWSAITGAAALAMGSVTAGAATAGATHMTASALSYAFDRTLLVSNHPFGYLHRVRSEFGDLALRRSQAVPAVITDPTKELRAHLRHALGAAADAELEQHFGTRPRTHEERADDFALPHMTP